MKTLFNVRHRADSSWMGLWTLVIASMGLAACFKTPDPTKLKCGTKAGCPADYYCDITSGSSEGRCLKGSAGGAGGVAGGSGLDGSAGGGGSTTPYDGSAKGGTTGDAKGDTTGDAKGGSSGYDGGAIDIPYTSGAGDNGATCATPSDCNSGQCVEGVCCETGCAGTCMSCKQLLTGKLDGTCAPVATGKKDPNNACKDETAANECGTDGFCDGAGACRMIGTDHVCATAACNGTQFTPTSTCDGKGACKAVTATDCGSAPCDLVDGCRTSCATDKDCPAGYCNATTQRCAAQKINGDTCSATNECTSGFCVDGVCCDKACTDNCMACSASLTTAKSGICSAVKVGTDPRDSCAADTTNQCGLDGTCDGAGACHMTGTDYVCKAATCTAGSFVHAATCDGKGTCGTPLSESCGAFTCDPTNGCQKACAADTDCTGKSYCDTTTKTCTAQKDNGKTCAAANECTSGNCVDGMCCDGKCNGACSSCKKTDTNVADGTCASVVAGEDPYNSCQDETTTNPCGNTGNCDGAGTCQKVDKNKTCGTASCSGATFTPASMCDGLGNCKAGTQTNCGQYQCSVTTGCLTTCQSDADCSTSTYCDSTKVCSPKRTPGQPCVGTDGTKCTTGNCVDGVCCTTATCSSCYACNINGNGTCAAVASGTTDPRAVCKASSVTCGQDGKCDGSGNCTYSPAVSGTCSATTCTGSTKTTSTCNNSHTCAGTQSACPNSLKCNAAGTDCLGSCTSNNDCLSGYYCSGGTCQQQLTPGTTCSNGIQCTTGNCADGVCCDTACTEQCKACNLSGHTGTCSWGSGASRHGSACTTDNSSCGGSCDGSHDTCQYPTVGTSCSTATCSNDLATTIANACNGGGNCVSANQTCSSSQYCTGTPASCQGKKSNTSSCSLPIECSSTICNNNVCCSSSQTGCGGNKCCTSGQTCSNGACLTNNGGTCGSSSTCTSGNCSGGYCCASGAIGCNGACCSGATPYCVGGGCKQCATNANCTASGYTVCSSQYTCTCDEPSAANALRNLNPGFDQNLNGWTPYGVTWDHTDAAGCSWSGSAYLLNSGQLDGCVPLPSTANGSTNYVFGLMAKGTGVNCMIGGGYASDGACTNQLNADFVIMNVAASNSWTPASQVVTPPAGTNSVGVACTGTGSGEYIDNLYFDLNQPGNGF